MWQLLCKNTRGKTQDPERNDRGDEVRMRTDEQRISIPGIGPQAELLGATAAETIVSDPFGEEINARVGTTFERPVPFPGPGFGNYGHEGLPEGELPEDGVFQIVEDRYLMPVLDHASTVRAPHHQVPAVRSPYFQPRVVASSPIRVPPAVRSPYLQPQVVASPVRAPDQQVSPAVRAQNPQQIQINPQAQQMQLNPQPQFGLGQIHPQPRREAPRLAHPFVRAPAPVIPAPIQVQAHGQVPVPAPIQVQAPVPAHVPVYAPAPQFAAAPVQAPRPAAMPGYVVQAPAPVPPAGYHWGGRLREYKFSGKIVDPGETDGMTYGSLMYQIESAQQQGYSDVELGAAIIRATKSSSLRAVLEARPGARIADLVPSLKAHFTVKGVNAVFNELCQGTQENNETALQFCQRMIGLRSLVSRMNNEEGQKFTPDMIQSQFQYSMTTGIKGEIRHVLRGMLRVPNVDDNLLMKEITDLMLSETEHKKKGEKIKVVVNAVEATENNSKDKKNKNQLLTEVNKISSQIQNLSSIQPQLDNLRKDMKRQERAFSGLYCGMTPQQKQIIASEYPELPNIANQASMYPPTVPIDNNYSNPVNNYQIPAIYQSQGRYPTTHNQNAAYTCVVDPNLVDYGQGQGYDHYNSTYRGSYSSRGGYAGGGLARGNFQHRGGNFGGGGSRGGGQNRNYQIRGGNSNRGQNRGGQNQNGGGGQQSGNFVGQNNANPTAPGNNVNAVAFDPLTQQNVQGQGNGSNRGNFGGRGNLLNNRGGHHGFVGSQYHKCRNCSASNTLVCTHCFRCGGGGHRSAECPSLN